MNMNIMTTENTSVKLIKELDVTDLAGEKVMIDFGTGKYFMLKGPANEIWDILTEENDITVKEIVDRLMLEYEVDYQTCYQSVLKFVDQMKAYEFVSLEE